MKHTPNPKAKSVLLHLHPGAPENGGLLLNKNKTNTLESLTDDYNFTGANLAKAKSSENRLLYLTPVLKEDIHISGLPKLTIKLASSKKAANLSVWIVSLPWNSSSEAKITDNIITRGWADMQNYKSLTKSSDLIPGKFYKMSFNLEPDDQIIKKGQQIGLMIFSSDPEFTLHPKPGTILTVDINSTSLSLPVVGGSKSVEKALN